MSAINEHHQKYLNLASEKLGAKIIYVTDDFFAPAENLLKPGRGVFIEDKYTEYGKWMDGWESRRKRTDGHDWCIIKLGSNGIIHGLDIDTNHFLGNHPPHASVEACNISPDASEDELKVGNIWTELLPKSPLNPGSQHQFKIDSPEQWSHLRLHIYPDGGVARLKVYGEVQKDWSAVHSEETIDLASALNGAKSISCNDMFFSSMDNLLMPGRGVNMGDGWETKRNRTPGNRDWVIIRLGHRGTIEHMLVDTCHFKGNYPDSCSIEGLDFSERSEDNLSSSNHWKVILDKSKLEAQKEHHFESEISGHGPFTHIRLNIFPDGGISRLRIFGKPTI